MISRNLKWSGYVRLSSSLLDRFSQCFVLMITANHWIHCETVYHNCRLTSADLKSNHHKDQVNIKRYCGFAKVSCHFYNKQIHQTLLPTKFFTVQYHLKLNCWTLKNPKLAVALIKPWQPTFQASASGATQLGYGILSAFSQYGYSMYPAKGGRATQHCTNFLIVPFKRWNSFTNDVGDRGNFVILFYSFRGSYVHITKHCKTRDTLSQSILEFYYNITITIADISKLLWKTCMFSHTNISLR